MSIKRVAVTDCYKSVHKDARYVAITPVLTDLVKQWKAPNPPCATLRDQTYTILQEYGCAEFIKMHTDKLGTHPENRHKTVLDIQNVEKIVVGLHQGGISAQEASRMAAIGRSRDARGQQYEHRCMNVASASNGKLAAITAGSIEAFTIACGHTKEAIRCINHATVCNNPIVSTNGRVDKSKFLARGPATVNAMDEGLNVLVIDPWIDVNFSELVRCLLEADNSVNQVYHKDSDLAVFWKIYNCAASMMADRNNKAFSTVLEKQLFWTDVTCRIQGQEFSRAADIPGFVAVTRLLCQSATDPTKVIEDLDRYVRTLSKVYPMDPKLLQSIADGFDMDVKDVAETRFVVAAIIKLIMTMGTTVKLVASVRGRGLKGDGKIAEMKHAVTTLIVAGDFVHKVSEKMMLTVDADTVLDEFGMRVVAVVLGVETHLGTFNRIDTAVAKFIADLGTLPGDVAIPKELVVKNKGKDNTVKVKIDQPIGAFSKNAADTLQDQLIGRGFKVGAHVCRTDDHVCNAIHTIKAVGETAVSVVNIQTNVATKTSTAKFSKEYKVLRMDSQVLMGCIVLRWLLPAGE
jgi:hypothetical protein